MHFYVHQLIGVRNLALACDMYRSVALLRYQVVILIIISE